MELHQLRTFVAVAREGSITRASELLHLSQPAVSAHIKAMEDTLALTLFDRTPRGMTLTVDGQRLLAKAEETLRAHDDLMGEATRIRGKLAGRLRFGAGANANDDATGKLLAVLSERHPDVEVTLEHGTSLEILTRLRNGTLDAGFYNEVDAPAADLDTIEVAQFKTYLVAPPNVIRAADPPDWSALAELPWIYPAASACCGKTAEGLFKTHRFRPKRVISVDRENVTRTLITSGVGVGLLHADSAMSARDRGEIELLFETTTLARVLFAHLTSRAHDPLVSAATAIMRDAFR